MFYLAMNLRTSLIFLHYEMDKLSNKHYVTERLKEKIQGKCYQQYGYVVQIPNFQKDGDDSTLEMQNPKIEQEYCELVVKFNAICFKSKCATIVVIKNDILSVRIIQVNQQCIHAKAGPVHVRIPRIKILPEFQYNQAQHCFYSSQHKKKIDVGSQVIISVFQVYIEMNCEMKILGSIMASKFIDLIQ